MVKRIPTQKYLIYWHLYPFIIIFYAVQQNNTQEAIMETKVYFHSCFKRFQGKSTGSLSIQKQKKNELFSWLAQHQIIHNIYLQSLYN